MSNLRQIGCGLLMYASDNKGILPPDLGVLIPAYRIPTRILVCPSSGDTPATRPTTNAIPLNAVTLKGHCSYVYVGAGMNQKSLTRTDMLAYEALRHHGNKGMNVLFGDGHVEWVPKKEAMVLLARIKSVQNTTRSSAGVAK